MRGAALVFPPLWYYASVPGDLLVTGSHLRARGIEVGCHDLNAGFFAHVLSENRGYRALRRRATYENELAFREASAAVAAGWKDIARSHGARASFYHLELGGDDPGHVPSALAGG